MPKDQQLQWKPRREKHNRLQFLAAPEQAVSSKSQGFLCTPRSMQTSLLDVHSGLRPPALHADHPPPGCLEFGPEPPGPGEEQGSDCKGNQDFPGFFQSGILISALPPCSAGSRSERWGQKGCNPTRPGASSHTLHTHTPAHSSTSSAPAPTAVFTHPGPYQLENEPFSLPTTAYTPRPHLGMEKLS